MTASTPPPPSPFPPSPAQPEHSSSQYPHRTKPLRLKTDSRASSHHHHHRHHHRHHRRHRKHHSSSPKNDTDPFARSLSPSTAFRESLFDALADDEGAAFWEGVYGQPIHTYSAYRPKSTDDGNGVGEEGNGMEKMTEDEYATYVRRAMWERSFEGREEGRRKMHAEKQKQREEAKRERMREREREERGDWERRHGDHKCRDRDGYRDLQEDEDRERDEEKWTRIWTRYLRRWEALDSQPHPSSKDGSMSSSSKDKKEESANLTAETKTPSILKIPWPTSTLQPPTLPSTSAFTTTGPSRPPKSQSHESLEEQTAPFYTSLLSLPASTLLKGLPTSAAAPPQTSISLYRLTLKQERVRWHPDRMLHRFGLGDIASDNREDGVKDKNEDEARRREEVEGLVTGVFQVVDGLFQGLGKEER